MCRNLHYNPGNLRVPQQQHLVTSSFWDANAQCELIELNLFGQFVNRANATLGGSVLRWAWRCVVSIAQLVWQHTQFIILGAYTFCKPTRARRGGRFCNVLHNLKRQATVGCFSWAWVLVCPLPLSLSQC